MNEVNLNNNIPRNNFLNPLLNNEMDNQRGIISINPNNNIRIVPIINSTQNNAGMERDVDNKIIPEEED